VLSEREVERGILELIDLREAQHFEVWRADLDTAAKLRPVVALTANELSGA
jgi:hypothetical protein